MLWVWVFFYAAITGCLLLAAVVSRQRGHKWLGWLFRLVALPPFALFGVALFGAAMQTVYNRILLSMFT